MNFLFLLWNVSLQVNVERFALEYGGEHIALTQQRSKTNGAVESHFRQVKHDLLKSKLRIRHSTFLDKILVNNLKLTTLKVTCKRVREVVAEVEKWLHGYNWIPLSDLYTQRNY